MVRPLSALLGTVILLAGTGTTPAVGAVSSVELDELVAQLSTRHWDAAVEQLVSIGPAAVEPLVSVARKPGHAGSRACEALARIGTPVAQHVLCDMARADDARLRRRAVSALGFNNSAGNRSLLIDALGDPEPGVRAAAAGSLGRLRAVEAVGPLRATLEDDGEWVRVAAIGALETIGAPESAPDLVARLGDTRTVQRYARRALVSVGTAAVPALVEAAAHPDPTVRWQGAWALGHIAGGAAREALGRLADDEDWRVRNEVAAAREVRVVDEAPLYPKTLPSEPEMASPSTRADGTDVVVAVTEEGRWAVVPARPLDDERRIRQRFVNASDFPTLARTGRHRHEELVATVTITGRSLAEITDLGRPGGLSADGFMAADEDVLSVLEGDDGLVSALGLTHPQMARPLFHVWNMIEADMAAGRWNHREHRWDRIRQIVYNGRRVDVEAHDTKGGQESIFDDGLGGAFHIKIRRAPTAREDELLRESYGDLSPEAWGTLVGRLTSIETGEMEPHYIQWYGFYEGHTGWRADPVALAFIFGFRSLEEIEAAFPGRLPEVLNAHFTR
jgi:HEAT repeat protein